VFVDCAFGSGCKNVSSHWRPHPLGTPLCGSFHRLKIFNAYGCYYRLLFNLSQHVCFLNFQLAKAAFHETAEGSHMEHAVTNSGCHVDMEQFTGQRHAVTIAANV